MFEVFTPVVITAPFNETVPSKIYAPTDPVPVVIFPDITELFLAVTPIAPVDVEEFTVKSILALSP